MAEKLKIIPLGGLNEIGKNMTVLEYGKDIIIIDCGLGFPEDDMYGVDLVIADMTYLVKNQEKIRGMFLTHGHEDHIGSIPYAMQQFNCPIHGTRLTAGLVKLKLEEHHLERKVKLFTHEAGEVVKAGCFQVEFIHVNHSIADAVAFAVKTPVGTLVFSGDFKIDAMAEDGMIDLARFAQLGQEGVLLLMADSTNAERPGYTQTEQKVNATFDALFARAEANKKRLIIATFASNISRVQQIINCAEKYGRKVALSGRSMVNVMSIASELGYLKVPDGVLIDLNMISRYTKEQIVLITTGSQGEPMSALTRMAFADHRQVAVGEDDMIIISARPIPGNEKMVANVVNKLYEKGAKVIYSDIADIHVSGHACQEELKLIHSLIKPKYFMPVHGEYRHLKHHALLAQELGLPSNHIFILENGDALTYNKKRFSITKGFAPAEAVFVDGLGVGDVGSIVLRDRKMLSEAGLIVVVAALDVAVLLDFREVRVRHAQLLTLINIRCAAHKMDRCRQHLGAFLPVGRVAAKAADRTGLVMVAPEYGIPAVLYLHSLLPGAEEILQLHQVGGH
mgnify:CR=1 FL=1